MPIAMVIASRNSFHVISDTLSRNPDDSFTINTQKLFYSSKHRLAMCISEGIALFPDHSDGTECHLNRTLHTNFIIKDFFDYLDPLKSIRVEDLLTRLETFLETHYGLSYKKAFLSWVDFFYGGFNDQGITTIYEYQAKSRKFRHYLFSNDSKEDRFFSNIKKSIKKIIYSNTTQENITGNNFLKIIPFFSFTIRHIIKKANSGNRNLIGPYLDYVKIKRNGNVLTKKIQYSDADVVIFDTKQFPAYLLYKSEEDSEKATERGELMKYHSIADLKNKPVIYRLEPTAPINPEAIISEGASQSSTSFHNAPAFPSPQPGANPGLGDETFHSDFTVQTSPGNPYSPSSILSSSPAGSSRFAGSEETIQALQFSELQTDTENAVKSPSLENPKKLPGIFEKTVHFIRTHPWETVLGTTIILTGGILIKNSIFKTNSGETFEDASSQPKLSCLQEEFAFPQAQR